VVIQLAIASRLVNYNNNSKTVRCSLLRAGVQPTLDPSAEAFMSVQSASPGRRGEGNW